MMSIGDVDVLRFRVLTGHLCSSFVPPPLVCALHRFSASIRPLAPCAAMLISFLLLHCSLKHLYCSGWIKRILGKITASWELGERILIILSRFLVTVATSLEIKHKTNKTNSLRYDPRVRDPENVRRAPGEGIRPSRRP